MRPYSVLTWTTALLAVALAIGACGSTPKPTSPSPSAQPAAAATATAAPTAAPAPTLAVAPVAKDWPVGFRGNAARTAEGDQGPIGNPVLRWRFQAKGSVNPPLAVADGIVYAASDDGLLHALAVADGKERWSFKAPNGTRAAAIMGGTLFTSDGDGVVYALDAKTGAERWRSAAGIGGSDTTVSDGAIFVSTQDGALVALDATTGTQKWRYAPPAGAGNLRNPATADGVIVAAGESKGFFAIDSATGVQRWAFDTGTDSTGTAVVAGGIAYVGSSGDSPGHLHAIDAATGKELWHTDDDLFSPAVSGAVAYAGSGSGLVAALDTASGKVTWRFQTKGSARPVSVAAGVVFVAAKDEHRIYALDASTGRELWQFDLDGAVEGSVAVTGGAAYIGTTLGSVYAIGGDGSSTLAAIPTPAPVPSVSTAPTAAATVEPIPATAAVEFVWSATADGLDFPNGPDFDAEGRIWVADTGNNRFAIFTPDGKFVEYWNGPQSGDAAFNLERSNGDGYGSIQFGPDGAFYVLDVGGHQVDHFAKDRTYLGSWGGFGTEPGQYNHIVGIFVDPAGKVHVWDDGRGVVETIDAGGKVLSSFAVREASYNTGNRMTLDEAGNVYLTICCEAGSHVLKFDSSGKLLATIGDAGSGPGEFEGQPSGIAVDSAGNIFVGQTPEGVGDRVLVFDSGGRFLASFGALGSADGEIEFSFGLLLDGQGNLYVTDSTQNRVEKFRLLPPLAVT